MKKNEIQLRYIAGRQDQPYRSRPPLRGGKIPPKLCRGLRKEKRVVLESESKMKGEKFFLVGNVVEKQDLCYYRELI
jgi:hypothetical protein